MRAIVFARRNAKEIARDPLSLGFGLGFPLVLLFLLSAIQANIPVELFEIKTLVPGICVFGFSFIALFSATLISKDRSSSFLRRLYTTPMTARDFIFGYTLPMLPFALLQSLICYMAAVILGLEPCGEIIYALLISIPAALLFIGLGLLFGSILSDKQVGGVCGALLTNLCAWLSGTWFDLKLVGGVFEKIAKLLPFYHATELGRSALSGEGEIFSHLILVSAYALVIFAAAVYAFLGKMKKN